MVADEVLEQAYAWLCRRRQSYPPDADIWAFRQRWQQEKARLRTELVEGRYCVSLLTRVTSKNQEDIDLWSARDALVLKALSLVLARRLTISKHCAHIRGHGSGKGAVRRVLRHVPQNRFVMKTDVRSYYASIDHHLLLDRLAEHVSDRLVLNLVGQYLQRCAERGGLYWEYRKGIALGSPLSPIIGAFFLGGLDAQLERLGLFFVRFMDDILVLVPTRWKLRRAVKVVNEVLGGLQLEKHPEKTFIGRIEKGFDFLGYHFRPSSLALAEKTVEHFVARAIRLYEQEPGEVLASARLREYVRRWGGWAIACLHRRASRNGNTEAKGVPLLS